MAISRSLFISICAAWLFGGALAIAAETIDFENLAEGTPRGTITTPTNAVTFGVGPSGPTMDTYVAGAGLPMTASPSGEESMLWIMTFLRKYRKVRPQLADASLVHLTEVEDTTWVFTLDRRDFSTYRFGRNRSFHILPEPVIADSDGVQERRHGGIGKPGRS